MTAIATKTFHTHNARQFVESLSETANDSYYLFIGRPTPWANGDSQPSTPDDSSGNTSFDYWNDMLALKRITTNNLTYVIQRNDWVANTKYNMFDHRSSITSLAANTSNPFYVITSNKDVFKCIYNGRANNAGLASNSVSEPTIVGQADISALTYSNGNPNNLVWKYLYTISSEEQSKYLTNNFIPVKDIFSVLNANGDVLDDASGQYDVFENARTTANGAIYRILVESQGSGYTNPPTVTISGDGSGADATANVSSGQVVQINVSGAGVNYSRAEITITANGDSGTGATATAILSPVTWFSNSSAVTYKANHGINPVEELGARHVMLYADLVGPDENSLISIGNDYRRIGIVKNPILNGTTTRATANVYSQTYDLTLTNVSGAFNNDEIVWQQSTNAFGVVVETSGSVLKLVNVHGQFSNNGTTTIRGIGNGNTAGMTANASITIPSNPEPFTPVVAPSGASADVSAIALPDITPYSGTILYVDNRAPITRLINKTEIVRTILAF